MKQTFVIKDTKNYPYPVIHTIVGLMADAVEWMSEHSELRDHAGIFPLETLTNNI